MSSLLNVFLLALSGAVCVFASNIRNPGKEGKCLQCNMCKQEAQGALPDYSLLDDSGRCHH